MITTTSCDPPNRTTRIFTINEFQLLTFSSSPFSYLPLPFISFPGFLSFLHFVLDLKLISFNFGCGMSNKTFPTRFNVDFFFSFFVEKCVFYRFVMRSLFWVLAWVFYFFENWCIELKVVFFWGCLWAGQKFWNFSWFELRSVGNLWKFVCCV